MNLSRMVASLAVTLRAMWRPAAPTSGLAPSVAITPITPTTTAAVPVLTPVTVAPAPRYPFAGVEAAGERMLLKTEALPYVRNRAEMRAHGEPGDPRGLLFPPFWLTGRLEMRLIADMSDGHLRNTIALLRRSGKSHVAAEYLRNEQIRRNATRAVDQAGRKLLNYRANPVVLRAHDEQLPVARASAVYDKSDMRRLAAFGRPAFGRPALVRPEPSRPAPRVLRGCNPKTERARRKAERARAET